MLDLITSNSIFSLTRVVFRRNRNRTVDIQATSENYFGEELESHKLANNSFLVSFSFDVRNLKKIFPVSLWINGKTGVQRCFFLV